MGTDYAIGIVKDFTATSYQSLSQTEWVKLSNDRLDLDQYTVDFGDKIVKGALKKKVFEENIEDFYRKLVGITANEHILNWFEDGLTDMDKYQNWVTEMRIKQKDKNIDLTAEICILFSQGKVLAEVFNLEPKLINCCSDMVIFPIHWLDV